MVSGAKAPRATRGSRLQRARRESAPQKSTSGDPDVPAVSMPPSPPSGPPVLNAARLARATRMRQFSSAFIQLPGPAARSESPIGRSLANLASASGCQDHTTSPYANAFVREDHSASIAAWRSTRTNAASAATCWVRLGTRSRTRERLRSRLPLTSRFVLFERLSGAELSQSGIIISYGRQGWPRTRGDLARRWPGGRRIAG